MHFELFLEISVYNSEMIFKKIFMLTTYIFIYNDNHFIQNSYEREKQIVFFKNDVITEYDY